MDNKMDEPLVEPIPEAPIIDNSERDRNGKFQKEAQYSLNTSDHKDDNNPPEETGEESGSNNFEDHDQDYEEYIKTQTRENKQSIIGEDIKWRHIHVNDHSELNAPDRVFRSNKIHTAKYTWYSFLPKNLFYQFIKIANLYFLVMM